MLNGVLTLGQENDFGIEFVMAAGTDVDLVTKQATSWREKYPETWGAARDLWRHRFEQVFTPANGHFSGNLPTLVTGDAKVRRLYYASILSLLCLERTNFGPRFPRVFVTASPRWATTLVYFWDTSFFATVWASTRSCCHEGTTQAVPGQRHSFLLRGRFPFLANRRTMVFGK